MGTNKNDWFGAGMEILGEFGKSGLTIERLTAELSVTKGSFYHHFKNIQDFKEKLVGYWANQYLSTDNQIPEDPEASLALLDMIMGQVFSNITKPEIAIRAWAQEDEKIRHIVEQIDDARHTFTETIFSSVTGNKAKSKMMADMLFTILIGSITAIPRFEGDRVMQLYQEFKRLYGLGVV